MSIEIRKFAVTTPAGTLKSAPLVTNLAMPARSVDRIDIRIPPGPNGVLGFALGAAGTAVIPVQAGAFIVTSDEYIRWELAGQIDSGAWQMFSYNVGQFDHTVEVWFLLSLPGANAPAPTPAIIPADQLAPMTADDLAALNFTTGSLVGVGALPSPTTVIQ